MASDFDKVASLDELTRNNGKTGNFKALLIGIDNYQDPSIDKLTTCKKDIADLKAVLKNKYGFSVKTILNQQATKSAIEKELLNLVRAADSDDSVLIYFTGRGETEPLYDYGWWLTYDSEKGNSLTYLENSKIKKTLRKLKAKHALLVSDAAFSANQFKSSEAAVSLKTVRDFYLDKYNKKSRRGLVSGFQQAKVKDGDSGNSEFGFAIIHSLKKNKKPFITISKLLSDLRYSVKKTEGNLLYLPVAKSGDMGGELLFINKTVIKNRSDNKSVKKNTTKAVKTVRLETIPFKLKANINDALIYIDGKPSGKTPINNLYVKAGRHQIRIEKKGYITFSKWMNFNRGDSGTLNVTLEKIKPKTGSLTVETSPSTAEIKFLNIKTKYKNGITLKKGTYPLEISSECYQSKRVAINIEAGKANRISIKLKPLPVYTNTIGMAFSKIEPGTFLMGSPPDEQNRGNDEKQHKVTLSKNIYMQSTEVTVGQWKKFIKATGYKTNAETADGAWVWIGYRWEKDTSYSWLNPGYRQNDTYPVTCISWNDANAFIVWLNGISRGLKYRLPTEAEWEYSCRAGSDSIFSTGDCLSTSQSNNNGNFKGVGCKPGVYRKEPVSVASFEPNNYNLFDMHGNVWEWCSDWYGDYSGSVNPEGPSSGSAKVHRGGGWDSYSYHCRSANRHSYLPEESYNHLGFRLVIEL